jgi:fumarylacetoacetase
MTLPTWAPLPADSPFGIDALPYGVVDHDGRRRPCVRVGDHALLLEVLRAAGLLREVPNLDEQTFAGGTLDALMDAGPATWRGLRERVQEILTEGADDLAPDRVLKDRALVPLGLSTRPVMPFTVADYVDFYCSINHATNMGRILRPDAEPLLPNWRHLPIGYHGRSGTVAVSGTAVRRPNGLRPGPDGPTFGPTRRLDFELEVGIVIGAGSEPGVPVSPDEIDQHVFGFCLVNDWSARDIQGYEYQPLGPFLGKSFLTSISPWIVPLEAVRPAFTVAPPQTPTPAAYLRGKRPWALPIDLAVGLRTPRMRQVDLPGERIARTDFRDMYWTVAQMVAHTTANGAHLRRGDLYASGTVSGTEPGTYGSLMELSWGGQQPLELETSETRTFLEDDDTVVMSGVTRLPDGGLVGWGEVSGTVLPAIGLPGATP